MTGDHSTINLTSRRYSKSVSYCVVSELIPPRGETKFTESLRSKQDLDISSLNFCRAPRPNYYVEVPAGLDRQAYPFTLTKSYHFTTLNHQVIKADDLLLLSSG